MELVPIITQVLAIVASIFILVLLVSFIASRLRKKEQTEPMMNNNSSQNKYLRSGRNQFYGGSYYNYNNAPAAFPKEIKVVKRTNSPRNISSNRLGAYSSNSCSRFTVINNITGSETRPMETDEYGFKVYQENEITHSVYLPN